MRFGPSPSPQCCLLPHGTIQLQKQNLTNHMVFPVRRQHGDSRLPRKNKQHAIGSLQVKSRKKAARDKARTCLNMPGPSTCDIRKQKTDTCW
ncbi:MAG: hypothetical protein AYW81_02085 [Bifidobacterium longum]|nr:MAG: hypothetical protein AYW81_02085 [Bifidobacterium longum]